MSAVQRTADGLELEAFEVDQRTGLLLERRGVPGDVELGSRVSARRRGWLVRRALLVADAAALVFAFLLARVVAPGHGDASATLEFGVLLLMLPLWVVGAKLYGLYERDEEHVDHSTIDEVVGVFHLVTLGAWFYFVATWALGLGNPHVPRLIVFWLFATVLVAATRGLARGLARRSSLYLQNTIIIGAGDVGQLAARKLLQHPEYGINLVGFVDEDPRPRRTELEHLDVVPRLFEILGPKAGIHTLEGLPLVGLSPAMPSRSSRLLKRSIDYVVALAMLIALAPLMLLIAICIRLDSKGPVLFRQRRLGFDMEPFTVFKFRTMRVDTDHEEHRRYIERTLTHNASPNTNGLYKLDRSSSVTRVGRLVRKTSLDELPQLFNILAGDMSLVGPRPCLDYETNGFAEHHFERFLMRPGLTGLWQVTARARSTFGEALDMDVAYVRGWSLSLDLRLLLKTPFSLLRMRATA